MQYLKKKIFDGTKYILLFEILRYLIELFIIAFTARLLDPSDFGIVALALVVVGITDSFSEIGIRTSIIQFKDDTLKYLNTAWTLQLIRGLLIFLILFLTSDYIASYFKNDELSLIIKILALRPIIQSLVNPYISYNLRKLEYKNYTIINFSGVFARVFFVIPLTLVFMNYWALIIGGLLSTFVKLIFSYILIKFKPKLDFNLNQIFKLLNFGIWLLLSRILFIISKNLPFIYAGKLFNLDLVGGLKISEQVGNILTNFTKKFFSNVMIPALSEKNRSEEHLNETSVNLIVLSISLIFPIVVSLFLITEPIVYYLLGNKWMFSIPYVQYFFLIGGVLTLNNISNTISISKGYPVYETISRLLSVIILCIFIFMSSSILEIIYSILISSIVMLLFSIYLIFRGSKESIISFLNKLIFYMIPSISIYISLEINKFFQINENNHIILSLSIMMIFIFISYIQYLYFKKGCYLLFLNLIKFIFKKDAYK